MVLLIGAIATSGNSSDGTPDTSTPTVEVSTSEQTQEPSSTVSETDMEIIGRAMMNTFVSKSLGEDWHMLALSFENIEIDEDGNGTVEMLYLPDNAGNGETKVNMTVEKTGSSCVITYIMLNGIDEVVVDELPDSIRTLDYSF